VKDVRLHYVERGTGTPLVLLHGNGSMIEDFQSSGLLDAAKKYRVIAFDRPGFGHSASGWQGIRVPKNMPTEVVDKLNNEINAALTDPKIKARLTNLGATVLQGSPADSASSSPRKPRSGPRWSGPSTSSATSLTRSAGERLYSGDDRAQCGGSLMKANNDS
jgi:hypothetical protein